MSPYEQRCHAKIAQCEANIRRFDNSGRDTLKRNYWWRQRRKWEWKLHPELKLLVSPKFIDFETSGTTIDRSYRLCMDRLLGKIVTAAT